MSATLEIQVEGATLHVQTDGSITNPALVLWPPGGCNLHVWDHLIPVLESRFHVVRIDVRGLGKSVIHDDIDELFTLEQYAQDACCVLDALGIDTCHSWSQSWGSRAAMTFAATCSPRVVSTALYAANADMPDVPAQREGSRLAAEIRKSQGIEPVKIDSQFQVHVDQAMVARAGGAIHKANLHDYVPRLYLPVLVGTGSHDPNLASSRQIAQDAPDATLVVLENVGHNAILEHPKLALQTFLDFHEKLADESPSSS